MPELHLYDAEREALQLLQQLIRERATTERSLTDTYQSSIEAAEREVQKGRKTIASARKKAETELSTERERAETELRRKYELERNETERRYTETKRQSEIEHRKAESSLKSEYQDRQWTIDSLLEAGEKEAADQKAELDRQVATAEQQLADHWTEVEQHLAPVGLTQEDVLFPPGQLPPYTASDPVGKLEKSLEDVEQHAAKFVASKFHKFIGVVGTMWCVFIAGGLSLAGALLGGAPFLWTVAICLCGAVVGGLLLRHLLYLLARKQLRDRGSALGVFLAEAERAAAALKKHAGQQFASQITELRKTHADNRKNCDETFRPRIQGVVKQCVTLMAKWDRELEEQQRYLTDDYHLLLNEQKSEFDGRLAEITARYDSELAQVESRYEQKIRQATELRDTTWNRLSQTWFAGLEQVRKTTQLLREEGRLRFPSWSQALDASIPHPSEVPTGIQYGEYAVDQYALPDGIPTDPRLVPTSPIHTTIPAFLPFPDKSAVLWKARDEGRVATVAAMQAVMLHFLTGLPPGKVRFTIIDPIGLGENFAAFMHLADFDEQLISSRIWTEPGQIETRLSDLTEHMENVIQKYLRNQYKSIEEYNQAAGEVAEPYRVLVIANFPTNFSTDAAKRLISVMSSGPACGVCTLVGVDTAAHLPRDFRLSDLEQVAFNFSWKNGQFVTTDAVFAPFPVTLDSPPPTNEIAKIVRRVGQASKLAARVEVPFEFIAPQPDHVWRGSTKYGFEIPIGRAGATRRQVFSLGKGTAQHALVAGKTGSGKSTLLHALITNLSLIYSPDEAELYLIDFKKGVEFKLYASIRLPHARVIAIESEREFGLSVLQRLDGILRERGEEFRRLGVNDVASYRDARPDAKLPRILLVVDEFQEFFVEEDKLAQEAALLLDRLVRQGRAFGVHVLLGSQTLGGAFSLARSTIDQMAVRIALQCSEADAQLILSKENSAARLLSRPGEAIYNDANGLVEGNDPFQVVWLDEDHREQILSPLQVRATTPYPFPLVFEGSASADVATNSFITRLVHRPIAPRGEGGPPTIWLGESVSIKDPTSAVFRVQSGANLLLIGQADESVSGIFAAGIMALAAQLRPSPTGTQSLIVLDGTPDDSDLADRLRSACSAIGLPSALVERYQLGSAISDLATEVERRTKHESTDRSPRFLFVNGLQRLRELRKAEDEFGFGRHGEKAATPGEHFTTILRDGPGVGIHSIVWCDSITNLNRALSRTTLREFTMRVLFQMNPNDSSQLIDTPAASRLGRNRALYVEDGMERPEKFRPYGLCSLKYLQQFGDSLRLSANGESPEAMGSAEPMTTEALQERA
jgi:hypothetical protein